MKRFMQDQRKGYIAGAVAGMFGGWIKIKCEAILPPRADGREAPPAIILRNIASEFKLGEPSKATLGQGSMAIHYAFSAIFGGLYGALAEPIPAIRLGAGTALGFIVWVGAHELTLPALGLTPILPELPLAEQRSEAFSHIGWGMTTELLRNVLRSTILR